jgi:erythromycin esterase-like protein
VSDDVDAIQALADFRRFPTWMWRNTQVVDLVEWLRAQRRASTERYEGGRHQ